MLNRLLFLAVFFLISHQCISQKYSHDELVRRAAETEIEHLPYDVSKIVVRGYDGSNPPPMIAEPTKKILYGYGVTAYYMNFDTIVFFDVLSMKAVHRNKDSKAIKTFHLEGSKYEQKFKKYFTEKIRKSERQDIWFEEIFISDKKDNILYIAQPQQFCPHCF